MKEVSIHHFENHVGKQKKSQTLSDQSVTPENNCVIRVDLAEIIRIRISLHVYTNKGFDSGLCVYVSVLQMN